MERVLDALPGVLESAVFGLDDDDFGEAVSAAVVREPGASEPSEEALLAGARESLAGFKLPRRVFFVPSLPRNAMGKVEKVRLSDELGRGEPLSWDA